MLVKAKHNGSSLFISDPSPEIILHAFVFAKYSFMFLYQNSFLMLRIMYLKFFEMRIIQLC